jgi:TPP-dependent pyruvate/acetoin dehydrogenase alpha subunit
MELDLWSLYRQMLRSRLFEEAVAELWQAGLISGEMHLGMGEEAIVAGVVDHLGPGDALALDHRGTPPLLMRGVDPVLILRELLGHPDGLCRGRGGHMHLLAPDYLTAASGIVGASGPVAAGFALAAEYLRPGKIAVAFFGEGAMNQGMLLEALNLAVVWTLPAIFVCKDDEWAITTESRDVTGGSLADRATAVGMPADEVDGTDVHAVWHTSQDAVNRARRGDGPSFVHARCVHLEGHFLGDQLLRITREPLKEMTQVAGPLLRSLKEREGAPMRERLANVKRLATIGQTTRSRLSALPDPLRRPREELKADGKRLTKLHNEVQAEIRQAVETAMAVALAGEG